MDSSTHPSIKILITPELSSKFGGRLSVSMTVEAPKLKSGEVLVSFPHSIGNVPTQNYHDDAIQATDQSGSLPLHIDNTPDKSRRQWNTGRETVGDVVLEFVAVPREVGMETPMGPRVDLRWDHGGLMSSGLTFIPVLPDEKKIYSLTVAWDLSLTKADTKAVWTFGEGPAAIDKIGTTEILRNSTYMVGDIQKMSIDASSGLPVDWFGIYWFGDMPSNVRTVAATLHPLFVKMSDHFGDPPSIQNPYRVFIRRTIRGYGGTGFMRSYVMEYDTDIDRVTDDELIGFFTHEMVHNWVLMDPETNGDDNAWYIEGFANMYSIFFPFRFGFRKGDYFQNTLNSLLMQYYTNPCINISNTEAQKQEWNSFYAQEIPYTRGVAYLLKTEHQIRKPLLGEAQVKRPLDDIVRTLVHRRLRGEPHGQKEYLDLLEPFLGEEAATSFNDMASGELVIIPWSWGAKTHEFRECAQEILDYGMDRASFNDRKVTGLKESSRAAQSGLKEDDMIVWTSYLWQSAANLDRELEITVNRAGETLTFKYRPRRFEKAKSWQLVKIVE